MNRIDLHVHTVASGHAFNTLYELAAEAARQGMEALAITDHGPAARDTTNLPYFSILCHRVPDQIGPVRIFKGIEANILDRRGRTDVPASHRILAKLDLVLAYMHPITSYRDRGKKNNTRALLAALQRNPWIDILAHPVTNWYDIDEGEVARAAAANGTALELNEAVLSSSRLDLNKMKRLIAAHLAADGHFVISSDTHVATELGRDEHARALAGECGIPAERIINQTLARTEAFILQRKPRKTAGQG